MRTRVALALLLSGCTSAGWFEGEVIDSDPEEEPPTEIGDEVSFAWSSRDGGLSGRMNAVMERGERFTGTFHQITRATTVDAIGGFYGGWYGGHWASPYWGWGGAWPYYDDPSGFMTYYTGRVVALLDSPEGNAMRCHFELLDAWEGMEGGATGECQVSDGRRIEAWFGPHDEDAPVISDARDAAVARG